MGIKQSLQQVVLRNWYQNTKQNKTKQKKKEKKRKKEIKEKNLTLYLTPYELIN